MRLFPSPRPRGRFSRTLTLAATVILAAASALVAAVPAHADSIVNITDSVDPATVNTSYTYTVTVNAPGSIDEGTISLSGASATITGVTCSVVIVGVTCAANSSTTVRFDNATGELSTVMVTVTVLPAAAGTVTADANFTGFGWSGSDSEDTTITLGDADIDVGLGAQPHLGIVVPYLSYTLTAHNTGPAAVTSATLTATLPAGKSATGLSPGCTSAAGSVTCTYGTIANGASVSKTFQLPLNLLTLGQVTVTGTRTASAPADPNAANDTASASCTVISIILAACP